MITEPYPLNRMAPGDKGYTTRSNANIAAGTVSYETIVSPKKVGPATMPIQMTMDGRLLIGVDEFDRRIADTALEGVECTVKDLSIMYRFNDLGDIMENYPQLSWALI